MLSTGSAHPELGEAPAQEGEAQVCALPSALPWAAALAPSRLLAELRETPSLQIFSDPSSQALFVS